MGGYHGRVDGRSNTLRTRFEIRTLETMAFKRIGRLQGIFGHCIFMVKLQIQ